MHSAHGAQAEPSQLRRKDAKLPAITGAAARNAGDADAELDEDAGPSSSAMLPPAGRAKPGAAFRTGDRVLRKACHSLMSLQPSRQQIFQKAVACLPPALPCSPVSSAGSCLSAAGQPYTDSTCKFMCLTPMGQ